MTKSAAVRLHTGNHVGRVRWVATQLAIFTDQPALDFGILGLDAKLHLVRSHFTTPNDAGVQLEQTDEFLPGRHALAFQHALAGFSHDLPSKGQRRTTIRSLSSLPLQTPRYRRIPKHIVLHLRVCPWLFNCSSYLSHISQTASP